MSSNGSVFSIGPLEGPYTIYRLSRACVSDVQRFDMAPIVGHMIYGQLMMNCNQVPGNKTIECV